MEYYDPNRSRTRLVDTRHECQCQCLVTCIPTNKDIQRSKVVFFSCYSLLEFSNVPMKCYVQLYYPWNVDNIMYEVISCTGSTQKKVMQHNPIVTHEHRYWCP